MPPGIIATQFHRFSISSGWEPAETRVIDEANVSLFVNGESWLSFTCTPAELNALAVGFLFNEGIIQTRDEIVSVDVCAQGTNVDIWLNRPVERPNHWRRTSGCTGGFTAAAAPAEAQPAAPHPTQSAEGDRLAPQVLLKAMDQLLQAQELYREAGGVHCSAVSDGQAIRLQSEDIGRHNTLDKLAGKMLLEGAQIHPVIVLTTGRVSSEMLQKSARMGAIVVVSRTSATSESVALADAAGITLVGYARRIGFLVYTHPERLVGPEARMVTNLPSSGPALRPR